MTREPRETRQLEELMTAAVKSATEGFARRAQAEDLVDIAYANVDSPFGSLLAAVTDRGLVTVVIDGDDEAHLDRIAREISPRILENPSRLDAVRRELDEYFAGRRHVFEVPVDLQLAKGFRRAVLEHLLEIPYGVTESYSLVAEAAGNPRAVRAAGTACATNPIPLVVPCHRVVRRDGTYGQYRGGPEAKHTLLTMEAAR